MLEDETVPGKMRCPKFIKDSVGGMHFTGRVAEPTDTITALLKAEGMDITNYVALNGVYAIMESWKK